MIYKMTEKLKFVAHPIRQLCWRHLASYACLSDGRQYSHLISVINILRHIIGEKVLKEHFKERYEGLVNILIDFEKKTNHIVSFCTIMNQESYRKTNFYNTRFRNYYISLQKLPLIHQDVMEVFVFLFNLTSLSKESIPSSYIVQASAELTFKSEDEQRRERSFSSRKDKETQRLENEDNLKDLDKAVEKEYHDDEN